MIGKSLSKDSDQLKYRNIISNTQDKQQAHELFKKFRRYELICGIFTFLTIVALIIDLETYSNASSIHSSCNLDNSKTQNYRIFIVVSTFISIYCLICKHITENIWISIILQVSSHKPTKFSNKFHKRRKMFQLFAEIALLMVIPLPYWDVIIKLPQHFHGENLTLCYRLTSLLLCVSFLRIYFVFRTLIGFSTFYKEQALIFCIKNQVDTGIMFGLKCMMKTHPLPLIGCLTVFTISIGMFIAKLFERPMEKHVDIFYDSSPNYVWYLIVTIGTQGYGDYTCTTYGCRTVTAVTWFFGSIIIGLLIVYMQKLSDLNHFESEAFIKIRMSVFAVKVLKAWLRFIRAKKRGEKDLSKFKEFIQRETLKFKEFRLAQQGKVDENEDLNKQIEGINKDIRAASKKLDKLIMLYGHK